MNIDQFQCIRKCIQQSDCASVITSSVTTEDQKRCDFYTDHNKGLPGMYLNHIFFNDDERSLFMAGGSANKGAKIEYRGKNIACGFRGWASPLLGKKHPMLIKGTCDT